VLPGGHAACILVERVEKPTDKRPAQSFYYPKWLNVILRKRSARRWPPAHFPIPPPRAWGPAATSTELTGPVAEGGTGSSKQDLNPPQGAYTRRGPRSRAEYPNHVEPHERYYAQPIRHSVDRKVALNRNYCRSVTIRTLGLKRYTWDLPPSNSRCTAMLAGFQTLIQTWHGPDR